MPRTTSPQPSEPQLDVLRYVICFVEEHGYQPTQAEMAAHFGVTKNAIQSRIKELARRGFVQLAEGEKTRERALKLNYVKYRAIYDPPKEEE